VISEPVKHTLQAAKQVKIFELEQRQKHDNQAKQRLIAEVASV
jgi:hypothetical protein